MSQVADLFRDVEPRFPDWGVRGQRRLRGLGTRAGERGVFFAGDLKEQPRLSFHHPARWVGRLGDDAFLHHEHSTPSDGKSVTSMRATAELEGRAVPEARAAAPARARCGGPCVPAPPGEGRGSRAAFAGSPPRARWRERWSNARSPGGRGDETRGCS
eukprot:CAMPEP_0180187290 /NCGR_PEP_ID=MMETSP0986-20121125/43462_1 /TAXON_ID=697907 /ORGANISM="non described non described, Strain CCMP2293" /LENGTH=157 /DNA_ID=CAMNT_0022141399 /DNA_START=301 /DNA_END=775 /DNA_ORIENTATION=+